MNRKQTREMVMQLIYQMEIHQDFTKEFFEKHRSSEMIDDNLIYYNAVIDHFIKHQTIVDSMLADASDNWKFDRVNKVELAILRLALTEMRFIADIPAKVSINEAVDLGKKFSDEQAGKFINGILSRYATIEKENSGI